MCQVGIGKQDKCCKVRRDPSLPPSCVNAGNVTAHKDKETSKGKGAMGPKRGDVFESNRLS